MNLQDAIQKAGQILAQERVQPTVNYEMPETLPAIAGILTPIALASERGLRARWVRENPEMYQFKSTNYDLLCAILDQLQEREKPALCSWLQRSLSASSFRHKSADVLGAGSWPRCSSELPLVAEFLVRRGNKKLFLTALGKASPSPGLTLLLIQIAEMIALNFTLFTDEEYTLLPTATESIRQASSHLQKQPKPISTVNSNTVFHVSRELPQVCDAVEEECRKARYLYVKASLLPGMNLEVNQDKTTVRTFLEKLGFTPLLIQSLDEAERLYRMAATQFELKSSMVHLRSFLEQLHLQACALAHKKFGGSQPSKWGEAIQYLRDHDVLTVKEQQFAIQFYALMSDTGVHPLVAEREYARLMRNMSIEYGLLLLTKLDKLGLK
jgi:hypothetical protein